MGETDKKWFYTKEMHADITDLGRACHVLKKLENRWDSKKEAIADTIILLLEINTTLKLEGHKGYVPKITILDLDYIEKIVAKPTAEELAAELEAKTFELKKQAEEKAKAEKIAKLKADLKELEIEDD